MTHLEPEVLALFAGGDLPEAEARAAAEHVSECEACRHALAEIQSSLEEFRTWAEEAAVARGEVEALHGAMMARLPRRQRWSWAPAAAVAAVVVVCGGVALWSPLRQVLLPSAAPGANRPEPLEAQRPPSAAPNERVKGHGNTVAVKIQQKGLHNPARNVPHRLFARQREMKDGPGSGSKVRMASVAPRAAVNRGRAGWRRVSLKHDADGEPMLQIATANPNVVILWYLDEGNKKDDE